jgi:hypothetical protein
VNKLLTTLNETMVIRATPDTRNAFDDEADEDKQNPEATVKAMAHNMGVTYQAVTDGGKTSRYNRKSHCGCMAEAVKKKKQS